MTVAIVVRYADGEFKNSSRREKIGIFHSCVGGAFAGEKFSVDFWCSCKRPIVLMGLIEAAHSKKEFSNSIFLSAKTGENLDVLIAKIIDYFSDLMLSLKITIPHSRMELVDFFYRQAKVKKIDYLQKA